MPDYEEIFECFKNIYGPDLFVEYCHDLERLLETFEDGDHPQSKGGISEKDSILITYGDAFHANDRSPLIALRDFLVELVCENISTVHLLPFFPYSSDDGFSIIDYTKVDPKLGDWEAIDALAEDYDLMFDAVINHVSVKSAWFQGLLEGQAPYKDYFITVGDNVDLKDVFRPRALPLLTTFETKEGPKRVWTTFSEDQVDLNYQNPEVLLEIVAILLMFVQRGARFIRLDAVAYIWKEIGTDCLHLENAHRVVQFFRLIFDALAPYVQIITETNVPHEENVSYFGNGRNEAQLVYNFSLPPLVLHAFHHADTSILTKWAGTLETPLQQTHFFNFTASHDGIGVTPAKGLIPDNEIEELGERVKQLGGFVSYKDNTDGSRSPYELNINYLDALGNPNQMDESIERIGDRFLASQSIMLTLKGLPGIYYHSLVGSRSWREGVAITKRYRTINREKLGFEDLMKALKQHGTLRKHVFDGYKHMLNVRAFESAGTFSPLVGQTILDVDKRLFSLVRKAPDSRVCALCVTNVTAESVAFELKDLPIPFTPIKSGAPLLARNSASKLTPHHQTLEIGPYGVLWLLGEVD